MDVTGKPMDRTAQSLWFFVLLFFLAGHSCATAADGLAREPQPKSWKADASLTDIKFIDRQRGWAVGSHGVLLRTEDGGKTWGEGSLASSTLKVKEASLTEKIQRIQAKQQMGITDSSGSSNFSCRFESVCFIDEKNGWAAGGYDLPWLNHSRAVIARTLDGGKSWQSLPQLMIGRIHKIEFRGMQQHSGWAIGSNDPATNASVFFTANSGNVWSSQKSEPMPDLIAAVAAGNRFVGIDSKGQPVNFDTGKLEHSVIMGDDEHVFTDIAMVDAKVGYAVGSNGAFMQTKNAGLSFSSEIKTRFEGFDFRCVHNTGKKVWFAGDPGHVLFSYNPASNDVEFHRLPGSVGINAIHFVDDDYGWVVGDLGKIWCTQDGGDTWKLQRSGSQRSTSQVGVLVVCRNESELPLEFIARHAGEDGKLVGVVMPHNANNDSARLAVERVGAAVVSTVPCRSEDELLKKMVRTIRQWRPSIILGVDRKFLEKAVRMAASEDAFPTQLTAEMKPWQSEFLMVSDPNGPIEFENSIFMPRTGSLLEDFVLPSRMLCGFPVAFENKSNFFAWKFVGNGSSSRMDEMDKSPFSQTTVAKRQLRSIPLGSLSSVQRTGQKREQLNWLLNQKIESVLDVEECKRRIGQLAFQFNATPNGKHLAGVWLVQLADQFVKAGKHQQAAFALEELARSNPKHCFAPMASTALVKYYSSAELNDQALSHWKQLRSNIGQANRIPNGLKRGPGNVAIEQSNVGDGRTEYRWNKVDLASALEEAAELPMDFDLEEELENFDPATVDLSLEVEEETETPEEKYEAAPMSPVESDTFLRQRLRNAANQFSRLAMRDPGLVKRADFLFLQSHIVKGLGGSEESKPYYQDVLKAKSRNAFSLAAKSEILSDKSEFSKAVFATDQRPHLDGLPNDPVWQKVIGSGQTLNVEAIDASTTSAMKDIAMVAHDDEYVYLYARCYKPNRPYPEVSSAPRTRDADLSMYDRVEFCFDVDRDLVSGWKVQVDWQGRVCESCGDDKSWNPKMFVARHIDDRVWSVECAIPIKDLSRSVNSGSTWRLNVRRLFGSDRESMNFWGSSEIGVGQLVEFE